MRSYGNRKKYFITHIRLITLIKNPETSDFLSCLKYENVDIELEKLSVNEDSENNFANTLEFIRRELIINEKSKLKKLSDTLKSENTILKSNIFKSCKELTSNSVNHYIEYFSSETSLTCRDLLSKNVTLVRNLTMINLDRC
jgi:hypothetical protein